MWFVLFKEIINCVSIVPRRRGSPEANYGPRKWLSDLTAVGTPWRRGGHAGAGAASVDSQGSVGTV